MKTEKSGKNGKTIFCINDGKSFDSITLAATYYGIDRSTISKQLIGLRPQAGGRYFIYVDNDSTEEQLNLIRKELLEKIYSIKNLP